MHAIHKSMSPVKRTRDAIDMLEHAMQGVHTSENHAPTRRFRAESGIVGMSSESEVHDLALPTMEREVIVRMPNRRSVPRA